MPVAIKACNSALQAGRTPALLHYRNTTSMDMQQAHPLVHSRGAHTSMLVLHESEPAKTGEPLRSPRIEIANLVPSRESSSWATA